MDEALKERWQNLVLETARTANKMWTALEDAQWAYDERTPPGEPLPWNHDPEKAETEAAAMLAHIASKRHEIEQYQGKLPALIAEECTYLVNTFRFLSDLPALADELEKAINQPYRILDMEDDVPGSYKFGEAGTRLPSEPVRAVGAASADAKPIDPDTKLALMVEEQAKQQEQLSALARQSLRIRETESERHRATQLEDLARRAERAPTEEFYKLTKQPQADPAKIENLAAHIENIRQAVMSPEQFLRDRGQTAEAAPRAEMERQPQPGRQSYTTQWGYMPDGTPQWQPGSAAPKQPDQPSASQSAPRRPPQSPEHPQPEPVPSPSRPPQPPQPARAPVEVDRAAPKNGVTARGTEQPVQSDRERLLAALDDRSRTRAQARGEVSDRRAEQAARPVENTDRKQALTDREALLQSLDANAKARAANSADRGSRGR